MVGRRRGGRRLFGVGVAVAVLVGTAGCGDFAESRATGTTPSTTTEAPTTTTEAPTTTSETTTSSSASSSPGGPLGTEAEGRPLTLNDFFMPDGSWEEKRYDIADQKDVLGIGTEVSCYFSGELELRLANNFDSLDFSVGQANDSPSSEESVSVEVLANGDQVEIRDVPFNQVQKFTIPAAGVNALKIILTADSDASKCAGTAIPVITGVRVSD